MKTPRWVVMGVAVAGVSAAVWSAALPDGGRNNPEHATRQQLKERRFVQTRREEELRYKLGQRLNAQLAERARTAEIRGMADDVARRLLRRVP